MNLKPLRWSVAAAGLGCLAIGALSSTAPSFAQMTPQSGTAASQAPTFGTAQPQAEGQPSWMEGMSAEQKNSSLHPNVPNMLGHPGKDIPIQNFKLPAGFKIELYAGDMQEARSMTLGAKGTVFVGQRTHDAVFAITDNGGKRAVKKILTGLNDPNGVAFSNGTLYVAERERVLAYDDIEDHLDSPPQPKVIVNGLPHQDGHFWKFMVMGPDGWLYFNQGSPTNITMPNYVQAAILRVNPASHIMEVYARGVRNSVGMAFHPETGELWFTDNGRDWLGEDMPADKLNHAKRMGENFGYPFCHQGDIPDPIYGKYATCSEFVPPALKLGPHVASLGMRFYTGNMFPAEYKNNIIIAEHGSWNRTVKSGYNLSRVVLNGAGEVVKYEPFLTGMLQGQDIVARVVNVLVMPDGSLLVSDDWNGAVYRITYSKT